MFYFILLSVLTVINSVGGYQVDISLFVLTMLMVWDAEITYMQQILNVHSILKTRRHAFSGASRFKNCSLSVAERTALQRIVTYYEKERVKEKETWNDINNLHTYSEKDIPNLVPEEHELTDSDEEAEFQAIKDKRVWNPISREWGPYPTRKTFLAQKEKARLDKLAEEDNDRGNEKDNEGKTNRSKQSTPKGIYYMSWPSVEPSSLLLLFLSFIFNYRRLVDTPKGTPTTSTRKSIDVGNSKIDVKTLQVTVEDDKQGGDEEEEVWTTGGIIPMNLKETINNQKVFIDWHGKDICVHSNGNIQPSSYARHIILMESITTTFFFFIFALQSSQLSLKRHRQINYHFMYRNL